MTDMAIMNGETKAKVPVAVVSLLIGVLGTMLAFSFHAGADRATVGVKLETMAEQIIVFDGLSMDDQIRLLRHALNRHERTARLQEQLLQVYLSRDLARLFRLIESEPLADEHLQQIMLDRLLWSRNRRMLERMHPRLKEGNAFIAVGAGHLPGPQGLLVLLHRAGYRLTPVY